MTDTAHSQATASALDVIEGRAAYEPIAAALKAHDAKVRADEREVIQGDIRNISASMRAEHEAAVADLAAGLLRESGHNRPDGTRCAYLAEGACNKCGAVELPPLFDATKPGTP